MPRSNWKGVISFGLVTIPVVLYPTKNNKADISFHQIDKKDNARIKYQRVNANTGKVVPWEQIIKGYEYDKDTVIPVPNEVLEKISESDARTVEIKNFISKKDLDPIYIDNFYYLVPDKKGDKGYVILREALTSSNKIGIAKVILSTKEYLAAVIPYKDALVLCILKYEDEINKISNFDIPNKALSAYKITKAEVDMAKKLIDSMTAKWKPDQYVDEYQKALHKWVEETVNHLPHPKQKKKSTTPTAAVSFVDLLKQSLKSTAKVKSKALSAIHSAKALAKTKSRPTRHATKH